MSDPKFSPECACGNTPTGYVPCPLGMRYPTWVSPWIIEDALAGKPTVWDARTTKCLQEAVAYAQAMRPEERIWHGLPEIYVSLSKEWDDPDKRTGLLRRMAASRDLTEFFSPHLSVHENLRLWIARFKSYIDVIEDIALHNVINEKAKGAGNLFYERF